MLRYFLYVMALCGFAANVDAADICTTVNACKQLKARVDYKLDSLHAQELASVFKGPLRLSWASEAALAHESCAKMGKRLPTRNEFKHFAKLFGAKGFELLPSNGSNVVAKYSDYNNVGYKRPDSIKGGTYFLWTSGDEVFNLDTGGFPWISNSGTHQSYFVCVGRS